MEYSFRICSAFLAHMAVRGPGGESLEVIQLEVVGPLLRTGLALLVTTQLRSIRQQQACKKQLLVRTLSAKINRTLFSIFCFGCSLQIAPSNAESWFCPVSIFFFQIFSRTPFRVSIGERNLAQLPFRPFRKLKKVFG